MSKATMAAKSRRSIDKILELDWQKGECILQVAKLIHQLKNDRAHVALNYGSFDAMIQNEIGFSGQLASSYAFMHTHLTRLRYTEKQAIELLSHHSMSVINKYIGKARKKISSSDITTLRETPAEKEQMMVNLSKSDMNKVERALQRHGMRYAGNTRSNISQALLALVEDYDRLYSELNSDQRKRLQRATA